MTSLGEKKHTQTIEDFKDLGLVTEDDGVSSTIDWQNPWKKPDLQDGWHPSSGVVLQTKRKEQMHNKLTV
jgi:hypothetical protein